MKVILLRDVAKVGKIHQVKEVADGYALNSLIPRGLAEPATPAKIAAMKKRLTAEESARAASADELMATVKGMDGKRIEHAVKADQKGHLYQKLDAAKLAPIVGLPVDVLQLKEPIKEAGEHAIPLKTGKVSAEVTLVLTA